MHPSVATAPVAAKSLPRVRLAVEADIPQLIILGHELHQENALMPICEERIQEMIRRAVATDGAIIGVIGEIGGTLEAGIVLTRGQFFYSRDSHLEEVGLFVKEEYRKSDNAKALIEFAKDCAIRLGCPLLIGIVSNSRTEQKARLYERRLGKRAGAFFIFNGITGSR